MGKAIPNARPEPYFMFIFVFISVTRRSWKNFQELNTLLLIVGN